MSRKKLILSTGNLNKVKEIKYILKDLPIDVLSKDDLGLKDLRIVENGKTLEENAIKKASILAERVESMVVMADDSGLFVDYLNGAPGIHSARYSGDNSNDRDNNLKLLKELKGVPIEKREAYFRTVIALVGTNGEITTLTGECKGAIGFEPRGDKGFGYDPLFIVEGYDKTFAELGEEVKNKISHRAKALEKLKNEISKILEDEDNENICSK
ncbi:MAG: XTP/dITP diphosphatase [Tissierellia bacterium]|nr:XTP/dITP diphosphatase [Tissierellia bacterium]